MSINVLEAIEIATKEIKKYVTAEDVELQQALDEHQLEIDAKANAKQNPDHAGKMWTVAEDGSLTFSEPAECVTIDASLTQAGQAADAKTVGDALAKKQPIGDYALASDIPDVPAWALSPNKPSYTASEVGALPDDTVIPSLDGYATESYVDENISAIPVEVTEDGYTDISGLRQVTDISMVKNGDTITVTSMLEGDETSESIVTLDEDGYPTTINTDGVECTVSWDGFEETTSSIIEEISAVLDEINGEVV